MFPTDQEQASANRVNPDYVGTLPLSYAGSFFVAVAKRISCLRNPYRQVLPCAKKLPLKTAATAARSLLQKFGCGGGI